MQASKTFFQDADFDEILRENMGDTGISLIDLDQVKIPSGGGVMWEVPGIEGPEMVKSIEGVIVAQRPWRAYYESAYDGHVTAPGCQSSDMRTGVGTPGGACKTCVFNQWGTAGKGKACRERTTLFVLREGHALPLRLELASSSLRALKKYFIQLSAAGYPFWSVVTCFEIVKARSEKGIVYSQVSFSVARVLAHDDKQSARSYKNVFGQIINQSSVDTIGMPVQAQLDARQRPVDAPPNEPSAVNVPLMTAKQHAAIEKLSLLAQTDVNLGINPTFDQGADAITLLQQIIADKASVDLDEPVSAPEAKPQTLSNTHHVGRREPEPIPENAF